MRSFNATPVDLSGMVTDLRGDGEVLVKECPSKPSLNRQQISVPGSEFCADKTLLWRKAG